MYDEDIKRIGVIWREIQQQFMRKPNDHFHVGEMAKRAQDECFKIGYVIRVHTAECLLGVGPATIEVIGRVPGHEFNVHGLDHERRGHEIRRAVERNEDKDIRRQIKAIEPDARPPK
jgi:hypothetical protein